MSAPSLLQVSGLTRHFGGVHALDDVSFHVEAGELFGLIGPNGAGKTTALNVVSGLLPPTSGAVTFNGRALAGLPVHQVVARGLARTYQNIRLFKGLTAHENLVTAQHIHRRDRLWHQLVWAPAARQGRVEATMRATELLERVGLLSQAARPAEDLAYGDQRRLEIARALATGPRLLMLDEPAAGMNDTEVEALATLIGGIAADGCAVVLVEHHVELVLRLCRRVAVLNFGRLIADATPTEIRRHPDVLTAYLGGEA